LISRGSLAAPSAILGAARAAGDDASFRAWVRETLAASGRPAGELAAWHDECLHYQSIGAGTAADYAALADRVRSLEAAHGLPGNRVFYLALPPGAFPSTIRGLGEAGLARGPGWTRLVVEKPFGHDLASAADLNALVHRYFDEQQVFRIDHYLAKETVQNLLVFRFSNAIFESLWNRDHIDAVQITVAEQLGVEQRAAYYDQSGALRDMVQNHATQLLSLFAMEVPTAYEEDAIKIEKLKVLRSVTRLDRADVVFGQYAAGGIDGRPVPAYRDEPGVARDSRTETFVALKVQVDNWRWQGVPFYIRSGKRLEQYLTQIEVLFRRPPVAMFRSLSDAELHSNRLVIMLQPEEGFSLFFDVKAPGEKVRLCALPLRFAYAEAFGPLPDAYETVITEVLAGVRTLFVNAAWVEESWRLYTPLLDGTQRVLPYTAGSWGPAEAEHLSIGRLGESGRRFLGPHSILPSGGPAVSTAGTVEAR
jgi:glucose-6-phosphate 1-dehydrogenase